MNLPDSVYPPGWQREGAEKDAGKAFSGHCGWTLLKHTPDFTCMEPKSGHPSCRQLPPREHGTPGERACAGLSLPIACRATPPFSQHLIFPNKRRNQAHKTQEWTDEQLCIYIEFPSNKACSPTSLSLFGGKLCFAFSQCPLPSPVCPPNLN